MPKVSVIVPVYKVEAYLEECVDSILAQTYGDYEIILVDDGSPDRCGAICDAYAQKDERIRVIHKENGGLSSARNAGLDEASGDYICFVDSDDLVRPELLETVVPLMDEGYGMVVFNSEDYPKSEAAELTIKEPRTYEFRTEEERYEFIATVYLRCSLRWEAWNRVFSRRLIEEHGLRFVDNRRIFSEDLCFSLYYLPFVERIRVIPDVLYDYRQREGSIMGANYNKNNLARMVRLAHTLERFYQGEAACAYLTERFPPIFFLIARGEMRHLNHERIGQRLGFRTLRRRMEETFPDWEYLRNRTRALLADRAAFHRYIGYRGTRTEWVEYYFAYALCMPASVKRALVAAGYDLMSIPVYFKQKRRKRAEDTR